MKYKIWDKVSTVYTPIGEEFTAEQWMDRYPIAKNPNITILCCDGIINGAFFGVLNAIADQYEDLGADFSACESDEDKLAVIEAFKQKMREEEAAASKAIPADERIAAALEYSNLLNSPIINEDDPDLDDPDLDGAL